MFKKFSVLLLCLPILSWAAPSPETVLTDKCLSAYQKKYKNKKTHKAFIYAREEDTGKNRCQWSYGNADVETAKNNAIAACAKHQLNAECIVVDADGEYLVKDGDFSLITPVDKVPLTADETDALLSQAQQLVTGSCLDFYKKHLKDKGHRVFAYSIDADGKYACGKSKGGNLVSVRLSALKFCERSKTRKRKKAPKNDCKIYSENKKILLNSDDYGISVAEKSNKKLSTEELNAYFDQSKESINKGPCAFQFKYYLRGTQHQAFYLATDSEGKQACGRSEGAFSSEVADKEALEECKSNVKKQKLDASCELYANNFEFSVLAKKEMVADKAKDTEVANKTQEIETVVKPKPEKVITPEEDYINAIYKGNLVKIKKYVETGLDVNSTDKEEVSPLFIAAAKGDEDFFKELLEKGANLQHKSKDGNNILIAAVLGKNSEIIRFILKKDFDVNFKGREGYTPLYLAVLLKEKSIANLLIKAGADVTIKNNEGVTVSDLAKKLEVNLDDI